MPDGRILIVGYKGGHLIPASTEKLAIGDLWAATSEGHGLFAMVTDMHWEVVDALLPPAQT